MCTCVCAGPISSYQCHERHVESGECQLTGGLLPG